PARTTNAPRPARSTDAPRPSRPTDAPRRSSMDHTPLPDPVPYHLADRTSRPSRLSSDDIDLTDPTRVEDQPLGSQGARRISSLLGESRGVPQEMDLSSELDTRQRPRIRSDELRKITEPPPTAPLDVVD